MEILTIQRLHTLYFLGQSTIILHVYYHNPFLGCCSCLHHLLCFSASKHNGREPLFLSTKPHPFFQDPTSYCGFHPQVTVSEEAMGLFWTLLLFLLCFLFPPCKPQSFYIFLLEYTRGISLSQGMLKTSISC